MRPFVLALAVLALATGCATANPARPPLLEPGEFALTTLPHRSPSEALHDSAKPAALTFRYGVMDDVEVAVSLSPEAIRGEVHGRLPRHDWVLAAATAFRSPPALEAGKPAPDAGPRVEVDGRVTRAKYGGEARYVTAEVVDYSDLAQ